MKLAQEQNYNKEMIQIHKYRTLKQKTANIVTLRKQQHKCGTGTKTQNPENVGKLESS
jgi:hypothetical protein